MERGAIDLSALPGELDLQATVESGQSYLWWRVDGETYADETHAGSPVWYATTARMDGDPVVIHARQHDGHLEWRSQVDATPLLHRRLGLADDLPTIRETSPSDDLVAAAFDAFWGLRIVRDPPFPTLVTFICSPQMRVARIHGMQQSLRRAFGTPVDFDGVTHHTYPTASQLAATSEERLRALGLGYRAPYVLETARMVATGEAHPASAREMDYESARDFLTRFVGVGDKVADCIQLFSLGFLEAVPLDTWMQRAVAEHFPACDRASYAETSRAIRDRFGPYAGYVQTYLFHFLRTGQAERAESF